MASEPARTRLLRAIVSLVLAVTFGHTTACRGPALTFSAAINFAMKRSAPCSAVMRHSPSSWSAVVNWSALKPEALEVVQETPRPLFFLPAHTARDPHQFSEHHALRQSRVLHARHKSRKQDPPPALNRLDALTSRLDERVQIGYQVVGAFVISPTNAATQEAVVGLVQRVVVARARASRDAAVQHCLEYLGS